MINPSHCENRQLIHTMPVSVPDVSNSTESQLRSQSSTSPSNDFHEDIDKLLRFLSHPTNILKRVPRLSRVTVARRLAVVIEQVVSRNDVPSWVRLLAFPKKCLCTPRRGGKRWSLATQINEQVSLESPNIDVSDATRQHNHPLSSRNHNQIDQLAARVSSKLEEGDYKGAVRLACSEVQDVIAEHNNHTLEALRSKHPTPPADCIVDTLDCDPSLQFTVEGGVILKLVSSVPKGSSGGSDGLLLQHLKDLMGPSAGDEGVALLRALVSLTTLILEGRILLSIRPLFFGGNLTALSKKSGGIRPIAVGGTLRRLASKYACQQALKSIPQLLAPHQLGFGVGGGAEAAVHASRMYLSHLPHDKAMVKVDFRNALIVYGESKC